MHRKKNRPFCLGPGFPSKESQGEPVTKENIRHGFIRYGSKTYLAGHLLCVWPSLPTFLPTHGMGVVALRLVPPLHNGIIYLSSDHPFT